MTALHRRIAALACGLLMTALAAMPAMAQEAVAAAPPATAPATEDARLAAFFEEVFQRSVKDSPIYQAYLGMKGPDYGKWNDFSDEEAQRQDKLTKQDLQRLHAEFDYDKLSEPLKISYRIFEVQTAVVDRRLPVAFPRLRVPDTDEPGQPGGDLHAEHPQR